MKKNHFIARKGLFSLALAAVGAMRWCSKPLRRERC